MVHCAAFYFPKFECLYNVVSLNLCAADIPASWVDHLPPTFRRHLLRPSAFNAKGHRSLSPQSAASENHRSSDGACSSSPEASSRKQRRWSWRPVDRDVPLFVTPAAAPRPLFSRVVLPPAASLSTPQLHATRKTVTYAHW